MSSGTLIPMKGSSLRRYEQRLERSEKTTSYSPGTTRMATAAHRARDRGASGDRRCLPESGWDRSASAADVGTATAGKTGQRGDHRVGRDKTGQHQHQHQHRRPFYEGKAKAETAKPANENEVTTGFGVELSGSRPKDPKRALSTSFCEPFRDAIELSLSRERNAAPVTAAEELLEIVMRRYERTSTLLTSNRPVEDWGKLLGDSAAVTAMLDRLLHHGHILKCGPRSWRTKMDLPQQEAAG